MEEIKPILNNTSLYVGLLLNTLTVDQKIEICKLDFNYSITADGDFLYFTVKEALYIYRDLVMILGVKKCNDNLVTLYFTLDKYRQSTSAPRFTTVDGKICFSPSSIYPLNYYICEDNSISIDNYIWESADYIELSKYSILYLKIDFLEKLCYAGYITDPSLIDTIRFSKNIPF